MILHLESLLNLKLKQSKEHTKTQWPHEDFLETQQDFTQLENLLLTTAGELTGALELKTQSKQKAKSCIN